MPKNARDMHPAHDSGQVLGGLHVPAQVIEVSL
jgi:hypothetical protein